MIALTRYTYLHNTPQDEQEKAARRGHDVGGESSYSRHSAKYIAHNHCLQIIQISQTAEALRDRARKLVGI